MADGRVKTWAASGYSSVVEILGLRVVSGEYAAGSVLTLERIQTEFAVSRTIAREVMRVLEALNLVTSRRRVGLIVQHQSEWDVFDPRVIRWRLDGPYRKVQLRSLTELRVAIEPFAAATAAQRATDEERRELTELAAKLRQTGEAGLLEEFLQYDIAFHSLILRMTRNEMFVALTDVVAEVLAGRTHHGLMPASPVAEALDAHQRTAQAISVGDAAAAEAAAYFAMSEVRATLQEQPGEPC